MKIILLCSTGFSTSLVMKSIQTTIKEEQLPYEIFAHAICEAGSVCKDCDVILLSPQVRFNEAKIKQLFPNKVLLLLSKNVFEQADGKAILAQIQAL